MEMGSHVYSLCSVPGPCPPISQRIADLFALQEKVNQLLAPVSLNAQQLIATYKNTSVGSWIVNSTGNFL